MKTKLITALGFLGLASASHAQFAGMNGGILLGGGYLEDPDEGYAFLQLRGTFYEDDAIAHTVFLEILGHADNAVLEFPAAGGGVFLENGDITFANYTLNYELEAKLSSGFSFYAGGGAGIEYISLDDRFDFSIDSDTNFVAQAFAGLRFKFGGSVSAQLGARYLWREDFALLGDQFVTEDSMAYELSVGFRF
ncbi:MAG: hypothetical protein ACJAVK_000386 [Akkermansiaceae bacterium]|jgi:hypothetical protein